MQLSNCHNRKTKIVTLGDQTDSKLGRIIMHICPYGPTDKGSLNHTDFLTRYSERSYDHKS